MVFNSCTSLLYAIKCARSIAIGQNFRAAFRSSLFRLEQRHFYHNYLNVCNVPRLIVLKCVRNVSNMMLYQLGCSPTDDMRNPSSLRQIYLLEASFSISMGRGLFRAPSGLFTANMLRTALHVS